MSSVISLQTLSPWNLITKIPQFVLAFGLAQVILEDNLVLYLCTFLTELKKGIKNGRNLYKLEGNNIRQRESVKQDYFTLRLKERKHNELFRREHFTSVYVTVSEAEGLFMFDTVL